MKMRILFCAALAVLAFSASSCNDDDNYADPEGTVSLNMLDELNGKTLLENSGIYIDKAQNFVSNDYCDLFMLGKSGGLGAVTVRSFDTPVTQAAVQPGYGYAACRPQALMRFPSGKLALPVGNSEVNYMKLYVASQLKEGDKTIGAMVKYALVRPETYGLPEYDSTVLTVNWNNGLDYGDKLSITLSDSDFEYDFHGDETISCEKKGRKLIFCLEGYRSGVYTLFLRIRGSYTRVNVSVL